MRRRVTNVPTRPRVDVSETAIPQAVSATTLKVISRARRWRAQFTVVMALAVSLLILLPAARHWDWAPIVGDAAPLVIVASLLALLLTSPATAALYRIAYDGVGGTIDAWRRPVDRAARDAAIALIRIVEWRSDSFGSEGPLRTPQAIIASADVGAWAVLNGYITYRKRSGWSYSSLIEPTDWLGRDEAYRQSAIYARVIAFLSTDLPYGSGFAWLDAPRWIRSPITPWELSVIRVWPFPTFESLLESVAAAHTVHSPEPSNDC